MKKLYKGIAVLAFGLSANTAFASPAYLLTHNKTDVESNAFVANKIPSTHPTKPHSDGKVSWTLVRIACIGNTSNGRCPAMIKMATNSSSPFDLGMVYLDLNSGDIIPKTLSAHGYTITVNGPGEATLTKG